MITQGFTEDTIVTKGLSESLLDKIIRKFRRAVYMTANRVKTLFTGTSPAVTERK